MCSTDPDQVKLQCRQIDTCMIRRIRYRHTQVLRIVHVTNKWSPWTLHACIIQIAPSCVQLQAYNIHTEHSLYTFQ